MAEQPGADELRMRSILRKHGVGPDAPPPKREDWWEPKPPQAVDDATEDELDEEEPDERPRRFEPQPGYWPRPHMPAAIDRVRDRAPAALSGRTRAFLYNASAAGAGWALGLYQQFAWAISDCGREQGIGAAIVLGVVATLLIAHVWDRRTRHWQPAALAWVARIPLATALLALALWAPAAT